MLHHLDVERRLLVPHAGDLVGTVGRGVLPCRDRGLAVLGVDHEPARGVRERLVLEHDRPHDRRVIRVARERTTAAAIESRGEHGVAALEHGPRRPRLLLRLGVDRVTDQPGHHRESVDRGGAAAIDRHAPGVPGLEPIGHMLARDHADHGGDAGLPIVANLQLAVLRHRVDVRIEIVAGAELRECDVRHAVDLKHQRQLAGRRHAGLGGRNGARLGLRGLDERRPALHDDARRRGLGSDRHQRGEQATAEPHRREPEVDARRSGRRDAKRFQHDPQELQTARRSEPERPQALAGAAPGQPR